MQFSSVMVDFLKGIKHVFSWLLHFRGREHLQIPVLHVHVLYIFNITDAEHVILQQPKEQVFYF